MSARGAAHALLLGLAWLGASGGALATEASSFGVGPRSRALAGAGATQDCGSEATFVNPAALAFAERPTVTAGFGVRRAWLYWQRSGGAEQRTDAAAVSLSELGFTLPLPLLELPLVLGFVSASANGSVAHARLPLAEEPQFPLVGARARAVDFDLALGLQAARFLSLGLGVRALSSLSGTTEVVRDEKTTSTRVRDTLEPVLAPLAGISAKLADTSLALVARAPLRADFAMHLSAVDLGASQLPPLELAGVAAYDPWTFALELSRKLGAVTALVSGEYQRFRDTPPLLPATVRCAAERPDCGALPTEPANFHDTVNLRFAAQWHVPLRRGAEGRLSAGYAFLPTPIPEQTSDANFLDNSRHRFALGYGIELDAPLPPVALDAAASFDQLSARTSHKAANVPESNPGAPELRSRGHLLGLSLALTVKL
ncbi:MAG TPA: hypothetical protein VHB79_14270 [Polyangiaceae bacterium]|nr:hypothetical protein [Polyangiaceae bacterium]